MKARGLNAGAFADYSQNLRRFIAEARAHGAMPVCRRSSDEQGKVVNTHGDYPAAARRTAQEQNVPLIDLHRMSALFHEALGPGNSTLAFVDNSHHNASGSYVLARCVVEGIRRTELKLVAWLSDRVEPFNPSCPDPPEALAIPPSPQRDVTSPEGN